MKVLAKPIDVYCWTDTRGVINPVRFKLRGKDKVVEINIDRIVERGINKFAGNKMLTFTCQSKIKGEDKLYELRFELKTCKWMLFKI